MTAKAPKYNVEEANRNFELLKKKQQEHKFNLHAVYKQDFGPKSAKKKVRNGIKVKDFIRAFVKNPL